LEGGSGFTKNISAWKTERKKGFVAVLGVWNSYCVRDRTLVEGHHPGISSPPTNDVQMVSPVFFYCFVSPVQRVI
jgi:hypothetical protein